MQEMPHIQVGDQNKNGLPQNARPGILQASNSQEVATILAPSNQVPRSSTETPKFGLTIAEKQSIEDDINAGKPIMATPAYIKFLTALLPNGLKIEDDGEELIILSRDIPQYTIHDGFIRANYTGAIAIIVDGLSQLFGRQFSLPMPLEIQERMAKHQRFPYVLYNVDDYNAPSILNGMDIGWTTEKIDYEGAPSAWLSINGKIGTEKSDPRYALSLFPYDGLSQLPYYIASVQRHEHKAKLPKKRTLTPNIPVSGHSQITYSTDIKDYIHRVDPPNYRQPRTRVTTDCTHYGKPYRSLEQ